MRCTSKEQETCNVEKMGCKGCAYNEKTVAKTDRSYCVSKECRVKCERHIENYIFDPNKNYSYYIGKCKNGESINKN